jgi:hypothetical protein
MQHDKWKEFFAYIKPTFSIPSEHQLSRSLLDAEYQEVDQQLQHKLNNNPYLAVQLDGWSNIRLINGPIFCDVTMRGEIS